MARKTFWFAATTSLFIFACGDKSSTGTDSGAAGTDGGGDCDVEVDSTVPADGATDAYYRGDVEFDLSEADSSAVLTVTDASGAEVAGSQWASDDGKTVYFTPSSGFAPSTGYTAALSACSGDKNPSISFTTSSLGAATDCDLTGSAFTLDLAGARFVKPEGVGELLLGQLEDDILVGVTEATDSALVMIGAIGDGADQDYCTPSIDFPEATYEDPFFSVGPQDTTLDIAGVGAIQISQLEISGTFASDCSYFGGGVMAGELDARELAPLVGDLLGEEDPDEICNLLVGFGVACAPCGSDGANYCIEILADQITADEYGTPLECIDETDCHPGCAASTCDDPTVGECD